MALKGRGASKVIKGIKSIAAGVQAPIEDNPNRKKQRTTVGKPLPADQKPSERKTKEFAEIKLRGSKGEEYTVVAPASYVEAIPKVWEWNAERYKIAELIADGMPIAHIPDHPEVTIKSRMTIYGWMEHPEFKSHIDGLIMETGWANRRERLNNLQFINKLLLSKLVKDIDGVKLSDKSLGAVLSALQTGSKLIAQEKGEFIEETKVTQDTNISGTLATASINVDEIIKSKASEEQQALEKEFEQLGDDIIRSLTGGK
jgi:hypothetical protein